MDDELLDDRDAFRRMVREFPVRTVIFTLGLPIFALLQLVNVLLHGGSLAFVGLFSVVAVAYSVGLTRYHVAAYRRRRLHRRWVSGG